MRMKHKKIPDPTAFTWRDRHGLVSNPEKSQVNTVLKQITASESDKHPELGKVNDSDHLNDLFNAVALANEGLYNWDSPTDVWCTKQLRCSIDNQQISNLICFDLYIKCKYQSKGI